MTPGQQALENKIRRLFILAARNVPLQEFTSLLPMFKDWLDKVYDQPTHSRFYLEELEKNMDKALKVYKVVDKK